MGFSDFAQRRGIERRCIVDENVESAAPVVYRADERRNSSGVQEICLERRRRIPPQSVQVRNEFRGVFCGTAVVNANVRACCVQSRGNLGAHAPRRACDQCDAAFDTRCAAHVVAINLARRQFFAGHVIKATF